MPKCSPKSAKLSLKSAILAPKQCHFSLESVILALKRGISHTTQGILSPIFHTKAVTAVAVRMHRSQQCAAPLAAKTQAFASPQCPNPAFVSIFQQLCTAFAAVAAYLCCATGLVQLQAGGIPGAWRRCWSLENLGEVWSY